MGVPVRVREGLPSTTMFETIANLILMLMIIGSGVLIVYVNVKNNPYEKDIKDMINRDED